MFYQGKWRRKGSAASFPALSADMPVSPRQKPQVKRIEFFRHAVYAAGAERAAACDAEQPHPAARPQSMARNRLIRILGAGRQMAACISDEAGQGELVQPHECRADEAAGSLPPRAGVIPAVSSGIVMRCVIVQALALSVPRTDRPCLSVFEVLRTVNPD